MGIGLAHFPKTITEPGRLVLAQMLVIVAEGGIHLVFSWFPVGLLLLLSGLATVLVLPVVLWFKLVTLTSRWVVGFSCLLVAIFGLVAWSLASSLLAWRRSVNFPEAAFAEPMLSGSLRDAATRPVHDMPFNRITILGSPEVASDADGIHILLDFRWSTRDRGLLGLLGERTYDGSTHLLAGIRPTAAGRGVYDQVRVVLYSAEPTHGDGAYLVGWIDVPMLMRKPGFLTDWVDTSLPKGWHNRH